MASERVRKMSVAIVRVTESISLRSETVRSAENLDVRGRK
jgi:hypothetical protein